MSAGSGILTINGSVFVNNSLASVSTANSGGGAIFSDIGGLGINNSVFEKVIVTDSLVSVHDYCSKIETVTISNLFGEAIKRIYDGESVSYLFDSKNITHKITNHH